MVEMLQAAGAAEGDDGFGFATHLKHGAVVQDLDGAPHRSKRLQLANVLINRP